MCPLDYGEASSTYEQSGIPMECDCQPAVSNSECIPVSAVFNKTGASATTIEDMTREIITFVNESKMTLGLHDKLLDFMPAQEVDHEDTSFRYPIICIINGAGGNGKDTFIEAAGSAVSVASLTSINEIRGVAASLIESMRSASEFFPLTVDIEKEQAEKSDKYREFLHELKTAWVNFYDGPNVVLLGRMCELISKQYVGGEDYDIIFLQIREPSEIEKMSTFIRETLGLICITVLITGRVNASEYQNNADSSVEDYDYDFTIENVSTEATLKIRAQLFGYAIQAANRQHGVRPYLNGGGLTTAAPGTYITTADNDTEAVNTLTSGSSQEEASVDGGDTVVDASNPT